MRACQQETLRVRAREGGAGAWGRKAGTIEGAAPLIKRGLNESPGGEGEAAGARGGASANDPGRGPRGGRACGRTEARAVGPLCCCYVGPCVGEGAG